MRNSDQRCCPYLRRAGFSRCAKGLLLVVVMGSVIPATPPSLMANPAAGPVTQPVGEPSSTDPSDLDSQERDLQRQRAEIDRKLADLAIRRHTQAATTPSTLPATARAAATSGEGPSVSPAATRPTESAEESGKSDWYNVHGQTTVITEEHDAFHAPYSGRNSLPRHEGDKTSLTGTLFLGLRLPWDGGQLYFDPEVAGGEGFGGVTGIAGFPNGEIPRVSSPEPEPYVARLFYHQTFGFGGEAEKLEDGPNQLPVAESISRLTVTLGKFSAVDFFQQSAYANDPRAQFMNWALFTNGAWDYPADTRGYTEGAVIELNQSNWSLRYGAMTVPKTANGGTYDSRLPQALAHALEFEDRYKLHDHPGAIRLMGYANGADMGNYKQATDHPGPNGPDVTLTRTFSVKYGFGLTADQELADDLGIFTRLGWNDGHTETWAFTPIDRTATVGLALKGKRWQRPDDVIGVAGIVNGLSKDHRDYLAAGGLDFSIGDGQLPHYAPEEILDVYYLFKLSDHVFITPDFQLVNHPAYNRDRGPVSVGGIRVHAEF